jgi:methanethiol S-methyltransferase
MKRTTYLLYSIICYFIFLGTILYAIGFVGNLVVSKTIDDEPKMSLLSSILIDAALLLLFALQHSIMARPAFKRWWTKFVPEPLERSTYVVLASFCLILLMWQWQPVGGVVWSIRNETVKIILLIIYLSGWGVVFTSTFLINHFDLFGLRQAWLYFKEKPYRQLPFRLPLLYRIVRHPLYFGFLIAFWAVPTMTVTHLLFAILTTVYILTAIRFEERDLVDNFGTRYLNYKKRAPMIIPFTKRKAKNSILLLLLTLPSGLFAQGMTVNNCQLVMDGKVQLVFHNAGLVNNGYISSGDDATAKFTGTISSVIGGHVPTIFSNMVIDKTDGAEVSLQKNISVPFMITMMNGNLQLNNYALNLGMTGSIAAEGSQSYITSSGSGKVLVRRNVTRPSVELNPGNIGVALTTGVPLGNLVVERRHLPESLPGGQTSIRRSFYISASQQKGLNAGVRFFYLDEELDRSDENELMLWKNADVGNFWTQAGVDDADVLNNWVYKAGLDRLDRFTLAGGVSSFRPVVTELEQENLTASKAYPNPCEGICNISFHCNKRKQVVFNLYDESGKLLMQKKLYCKKGANVVSFDLSVYPSGIYLVSDDSKTVQQKIIRQ